MIQCNAIQFNYPNTTFGLNITELQISEGEQLAIIGPSGCGKTTLIHLISSLLTPNSGTVTIDEIVLSDFKKRDRNDFRILRMGLIFQEFELLTYLNVLDNILLPYRINSILEQHSNLKQRAEQLAEMVGLNDKLLRYPKHLSQGERQRVAVCRALITKPKILLCDEPTANLDPINRDLILDILFEYSKTHKTTLVMVTHDQDILSRFERIIDVKRFAL
ncbi:ABC transporter ATP-binding protein [Formosa haliotis]|uniref:ABC transporter ATP-binding protein n=1 Tax=Formosa haliotis TaxID=1555194 RepID=UPI000824876F|nr:ABC transporter ATP-binding protein [Formosa haliotis]